MTHRRQEPRVLNNFVTELVRLGDVSRDGEHWLSFRNPREGWILFRAAAWAGPEGRMSVALAPAEGGAPNELIALEPGEKRTIEVMRHLAAGAYSLRVDLRDTKLTSLSVRTIPVLVYATFNYPPYMQRFGRYEWGWLKQIGMLDACNVIVCGHDPGYAMKKWLASGRHIVTHAGVPGLVTLGKKHDTITEEACYDYWIKQPGLNDPRFLGALVDEFYAAPTILEHFATYVAAIRRVVTDRPDHRFYAYLGDDNPPLRVGNAVNLRPFVEPLAKAGCYFAFERYLQEKPTEKEAREFMEAALTNEMLEFKKYAPDFAERCLYVMGFLCAGSCNLNNNPQVNFKVHLDMQFHLLATDPAFEGLHGVEEYNSGYCDEEYMRWCAKLFRHYCIEGRTDRLTNDPYELNHIQNGDFENGLDGWTVQAASPGSVKARSMKGYGNLQGRYPKSPQGDTFLWTRRDKNKPNVISQTIRNLEPGRFYSVKMLTGDFKEPTKNVPHLLWLEVQGAEKVPGENVRGAYSTRHSESARKYGSATTYFNYHRIVFRATAPTAELRIYDWYTPTYRKGPAGREFTINAVEVEPYLMPDAYSTWREN